MSKKKIVIIGSNANRIEVQGGGTGATGNYLNEMIVPALALVDAGYEVILATPNGNKPHIDAASDSVKHFDNNEVAYRRAKAFFADDPSMNQGRTLRSIIDEGLEKYAAVFVPGGQAPIVDLMQDPELGQILRHFHERKKPTAFLCHGPIAAMAALPESRRFKAALIAGDDAKAAEIAKGWQYAGYKLTVFTESEDKLIEDQILHAKLYFYMPEALMLAGAEFSRTPVDFDPYVVEDRELITGQNPRSDHLIAARLIAALGRMTMAA
jgi:putative intracellular protease/amidase